jgi:hypothetical protein
MTWSRAWREIFASPHGELICMADLLGHEGVSSQLSLLGSMKAGLGWELNGVLGLVGG